MSGIDSSARANAATEAPALVSFSVHSLPSPEGSGAARRTARGRLLMLLVLATCAAPVVASYYAYFVVRPEARTNYSELIAPPRSLPVSLPLVDLRGRAVPAIGLRDQWLLIVVAGGACNARCEHYLWLQRQLHEALGREKGRVDKVWLIDDGVVPRPETLAAIAATGDGTPAAIAPTQALQANRAELAAWLAPAPGHALEDHLYIVDPNGDWMMRAPVDPDPARLKRDIDKLLRASAGWDQPGR
jgi:hypothetical protein